MLNLVAIDWMSLGDVSINIAKLIWNIAETIEHLSAYWRLEPGDLIFTGTPEGVGAVVRGDLMQGSVEGVAALSVKMI